MDPTVLDLRLRVCRAIQPCACHNLAPCHLLPNDSARVSPPIIRESNLLKLPSVIRRSIYCLAGLIHRECIFLAKPQHAEYSPSDAELQITFSLLLTCKKINAEVTRIVYGENQILFLPSNCGDITILSRFSPQTISLMSDLAVHLSIVSCTRYPERTLCCPAASQPAKWAKYHNDPIGELKCGWQDIFAEWNRTMRWFLLHVPRNQLKLSIICDAASEEASALALAPLEGITHLKECSVRLESERDTHRQSVAREAALRSTGVRPDTKKHSFRYLSLPYEIRCKTLEYSDLVTPLKEVSWSPERGYHLVFTEYFDLPPAPEHYAYRYIECDRTMGCFCMRRHSAYTLKCSCWAPPVPFFLVCHDMRKDAESVFFRCNRFVVMPTGRHDESSSVNLSRLEASIFLTTQVTPSALRCLRDLEIVIPPFLEGFFANDGDVHSDWTKAIKSLKSTMCLSLLTLRVYLCDYDADGTGVTNYRARMTKDQALDMVRTYLRILRPLAQYRSELRRLYIHLSHPLKWTRTYRLRNQARIGYIQAQNKQLENMVERGVMGPEFDRLRQGKDEKNRSQWLTQADWMSGAHGPMNPLLWYA